MVKHAKRRKPYRKYNSKFQALPVNDTSALGTLADATVLRSGLTNLSDDFWFQSADLMFTLDGLTPGEAPIMVGVAHGDLSVVEIKEAIEAKPTNRGDIVAREQARRPVRQVGTFAGQVVNDTLNDGKPIRVPLKMYVAEGIELNMFSFNRSGAVLTTGATVSINGVLYGEWR